MDLTRSGRVKFFNNLWLILWCTTGEELSQKVHVQLDEKIIKVIDNATGEETANLI